MQTIEMNDLVSTAFEACAGFESAEAATHGAPICGGCGWLESEHDRPVAEVRVLPRRPRTRLTPKRLAS